MLSKYGIERYLSEELKVFAGEFCGFSASYDEVEEGFFAYRNHYKTTIFVMTRDEIFFLNYNFNKFSVRERFKNSEIASVGMNIPEKGSICTIMMNRYVGPSIHIRTTKKVMGYREQLNNIIRAQEMFVRYYTKPIQ